MSRCFWVNFVSLVSPPASPLVPEKYLSPPQKGATAVSTPDHRQQQAKITCQTRLSPRPSAPPVRGVLPEAVAGLLGAHAHTRASCSLTWRANVATNRIHPFPADHVANDIMHARSRVEGKATLLYLSTRRSPEACCQLQIERVA